MSLLIITLGLLQICLSAYVNLISYNSNSRAGHGWCVYFVSLNLTLKHFLSFLFSIRYERFLCLCWYDTVCFLTIYLHVHTEHGFMPELSAFVYKCFRSRNAKRSISQALSALLYSGHLDVSGPLQSWKGSTLWFNDEVMFIRTIKPMFFQIR